MDRDLITEYVGIIIGYVFAIAILYLIISVLEFVFGF